MVNNGGDLFQNAEEEKNDIMSKSWDTYEKTTDEIKKRNDEDDKNKQIKKDENAVPDGELSLKGIETKKSLHGEEADKHKFRGW